MHKSINFLPLSFLSSLPCLLTTLLFPLWSFSSSSIPFLCFFFWPYISQVGTIIKSLSELSTLLDVSCCRDCRLRLLALQPFYRQVGVCNLLPYTPTWKVRIFSRYLFPLSSFTVPWSRSSPSLVGCITHSHRMPAHVSTPLCIHVYWWNIRATLNSISKSVWSKVGTTQPCYSILVEILNASKMIYQSSE